MLLYGDLDEECDTELSKWFHTKGENKICKLHKALYVL